jgi:hypothetical protein
MPQPEDDQHEEDQVPGIIVNAHKDGDAFVDSITDQATYQAYEDRVEEIMDEILDPEPDLQVILHEMSVIEQVILARPNPPTVLQAFRHYRDSLLAFHDYLHQYQGDEFSDLVDVWETYWPYA